MTRTISPWRWFFVAIVLVVFLLPPVWLFLSSLKSKEEIFQWPPSLWPEHPTLGNFIETVSQFGDRLPALGAPRRDHQRHGRLCAGQVPLPR